MKIARSVDGDLGEGPGIHGVAELDEEREHLLVLEPDRLEEGAHHSLETREPGPEQAREVEPARTDRG